MLNAESYISPLGDKLFEKEVSRLEEIAREKKRGLSHLYYGDPGDSWHDPLFQRAQQEVEAMAQQIVDLRAKHRNSTIINLPKNNSRVELGHKVYLEMVSRAVLSEKLYVTILGSLDIFVLKRFFSSEDDILVSDETPLGRCLIGTPAGTWVMYTVNDQNFRVRVESIMVSPVAFDVSIQE